MTFTLHMLRNAHTREELAFCWKVFGLCKHLKTDHDWKDENEAFKKRALELGLDWKQ